MRLSAEELLFRHEVESIRTIEAGRVAATLGRPLPHLSPEHEVLLSEFIDRKLDFNRLPPEVQFFISIKSERDRLADPYRYSSLPERLSQQVWNPRDGLLLLAGISPMGALIDWTWNNYMGAEIFDSPKIRNALPLTAGDDFYLTPVAEAWSEEIAEMRRVLREDGPQLQAIDLERTKRKVSQWLKHREDPEVVEKSKLLDGYGVVLGRLVRRWNSTDHDIGARYAPAYFLKWASENGFTPEWAAWALKEGLIDAHDSVYRAPFFDPDAEDYPELLHIAVAAWEYARRQSSGTPKQRIERFLAERYGSTIPRTTRGLIAQVANWQRTGGRPEGGKT